ncbi:MAG TPA: hypothetical protein DCE41_17930 [Cytophagales bacterium]|nr:hypothetical protein [Cytophagales bacterium]HAA23647.1 hypothetical protein [Cytophagales bacterium]HAP65370.1 hypothetical protein [Cytophagales bacterium]
MNEQQQIKEWFDNTYKVKGFRYLRPLAAYRIFGTLLESHVPGKHLDIACGLGLMLRIMQGKGSETYGVDLSSEAVAKAKQFVPKADIQEANAEQLPFSDGTFRTVSCIGSLERMLNREKALQEMYRVTQPGGRICIMVRNPNHYMWHRVRKPLGIVNKKGHQDALTLEYWRNLFADAGFAEIQAHPDHWPHYRLQRLLQPWKNIDTSQVKELRVPLEYAYEFIFLLEKPT